MKFLILAIFLFSCVSEDPIVDSNIIEENSRDKELWVCYHPGTKFHDKICVEDYSPQGCYVKGDNSKFCWILERKDCDREDLESQDFCRVFYE